MRSTTAQLAVALLVAAGCASGAACSPKAKPTDALKPWYLAVSDVPAVLNQTATITEDAAGNIWFGGAGGVVRFNPRENQWRVFSTTDGLAEAFVGASVADDKSVLFAGNRTIVRYDLRENRWSTVSDDMAFPRFATAKGWPIYVYGSLSSISLVRYDPETRGTRETGFGTFLETLPFQRRPTGAAGVSVSPVDGSVWILTNNQRLIRYSETATSAFRFVPLPSSQVFFQVLASSDGYVWLGTRDSVIRIDPTKEDVRHFPMERLGRMFADREGRMCVVSGPRVLRFEASSSQWIPLFEVSADTTERFLIARDGRTWGVGPEGFGVLDASRKKWTPIRVDQKLPGNRVESFGVVGGRNGFVWATATYATTNGYRILGSSRFSLLGWAGLGVSAEELVYGTRGTLAAGRGFGITLKSPNRVTRFRVTYPRSHGYVIDDERDRLWYLQDGVPYLCDIRDEKLCRPSLALRSIGLNSADLLLAGRNGTVWFATSKGLVEFDPSREQGHETTLYPRFSGVTALLQEPDGTVWIANASPDRQGALGSSPTTELFRIAVDGARQAPTLSVKFRVSEITKDESGHLWLMAPQGTAMRFHPETSEVNPISLPAHVIPSSRLQKSPAVDSKGRIWYATENGMSRQEWLPDGTPKRPHTYPLTGMLPKLTAVAARNGTTYRWDTRPTGLMRTGPTGAKAVPYKSDAGDLLALVGAPNGGAWLAQTDAGLSFYDFDGRRTDIGVDNGLPDSTVRDISLVPGTTTPRAWVATDAGAALVSDSRVEKSVKTGGPIDAIAAMSDGSAWLAFNPISPDLYLESSIANRRQRAYLQQVATDGSLKTRIEFAKGEILDLVAGGSDTMVWVGTSAGLYRLDVATSRLEAVTAKGRLQPQAVPRLVVEPTGSVWMAANAPNADSFASIVGYDPIADDIQVYTVDRGLPRARTINALDITPEGDLVAEAAGRIVYGAVYVPGGISTSLIVLIVAFTLTAGAGAGQLIRIQRTKSADRAAYRPLSDLVDQFFTRAGFDVKRLDYRTSRVQAHGADGASLIVCALGDLLPVQEVINGYERIRRETEGDAFRAYLAYPREIDPAATRQLDVYRLQRGAVIIPISGTFMRAKLEEGEEKPRGALDGLNRRYLGFQDLFDVKNAIDEPRFFFGRRALLGDLEQALNRREHVAIVGARKAGKSSLMNLLQQRLESFPVAKIDFQIYQRDDETWPAKFLVRIVESYDGWGRIRFGPRWQMGSLPEGSMTGPSFRQALIDRRDRQQALTGTSQPLVILLDEIERVFPYGNEKDVPLGPLVQRAERYIATMGILRALGQEEGNRLVSIVVADLKLDFNRVNAFDIRGVDTNPFYRFFQERFLTPLNSDECLEMVTEIGHAMGLTIESDVQERIFADSGGHVALARQLGSAACRMRAGSQTLTLAHYEDGLASLEEETGDLDVYFAQNFWNVSSEIERSILRCGSSDDGATDESFQMFASGEGLPVDGTLEARRHFLTTGMLERIGDRRYRVAGQLFRNWLARKTDSALAPGTM